MNTVQLPIKQYKIKWQEEMITPKMRLEKW